MTGAVIEYSTDGGTTWIYGRAVPAWVVEDRAVLDQQRAIVRSQVADGGRSVRTRVVREEL